MQKGMSLHDVQEASGGKWKAAVVGAYERGDRNVTVARLSELAGFYGVPLAEVLPDNGSGPTPALRDRRRVVLDLAGLQRVPEAMREPVARFASAIQLQRGDFNGRVLTIRDSDLMALGLMYEMPADELAGRLVEWGVAAE